MCPLDRSPHGGEILHTLPEAPFPVASAADEKPEEKPEEKPREKPDQGPHGRGLVPGEGGEENDIAQRPPIPSGSERMAADIEDEEADPVVESGPGVDDAGEGRVRRAARELGLLRA